MMNELHHACDSMLFIMTGEAAPNVAAAVPLEVATDAFRAAEMMPISGWSIHAT